MNGSRKLIMCLAYIAAVTSWVLADIRFCNGANLGSVAALAGTSGAGVFGLAWGNVQEHRAKAGQP